MVGWNQNERGGSFVENIFCRVREALRRGEPLALCTVLSSSGSTPRGPGARMAVFADGTIAGTIGGGAAERLAREEAQTVLSCKSPRIRTFRLYPNGTEDIGMICGGSIRVSFQVLLAADLPLVEQICHLREGGSPAWLVTAMPGEGPWHMEIWTGERTEGVRLPPERVEPLLGVRPALEEGEPPLFAEPLARQGVVYIFGAGHVGRELAWMLDRAGFRLAVFDNRPESLAPENFPAGVRLIQGDFGQIDLPVAEMDCVVVMTAGHQGDLAVIEQMLRTPAGYIGCIGSRRKAAAMGEQLKEHGFTDAAVSRIHSPIGLPIGGETPAEIAVSIAAELIAHRSGKELPRG